MSDLPDATTLARMGQAAETALLSELGHYDAGKAAWLAMAIAEVEAIPDSEIDTSDIPETASWPARQSEINARFEVAKRIREARGA